MLLSLIRLFHGETKYYYKHSNFANQACYYCIVQRDKFTSEGISDDVLGKHKNVYLKALIRERYVAHDFINREY